MKSALYLSTTFVYFYLTFIYAGETQCLIGKRNLEYIKYIFSTLGSVTRGSGEQLFP